MKIEPSAPAGRAACHTLSIAGVDPSGGAGVLADVKTMSALGAYACGVIAALTAQSTQGVTGIHPVPPEFVKLQIDTLFADMRIDAVKLGMLGQAPVIGAVAESLARHKPEHLVLDPVMVAKSGHALLEDSAVGAMREAILPMASMITPNLPEAGVLLGQRGVETVSEMRRVAERLREAMGTHGHRWVLLKGGHLPGDVALDLLHDGDRMIELAVPKLNTRNTHGTGCTLSSALAALLPQRGSVPEAARDAKRYLTEALAQADRLAIGKGQGPLHHFYRWW
ncbi:bifunctional hydroxymethylpyrimidine kinase/phosphomethylpyrimidine kinase [Achromobacter sp. GG226]|uniref:bifunctional hydroxymethylpyrimidine kinase/phosphomethylpyrimidine kinase n=1 Tax=Verticiella alkaliphila TaxID=2779529 RepID=UPI001C0D6E13|nr:bifunctional hydroxymethylpyrimidine kinase/phosphomethylpyrimidine kinase [Verticiella sp. GG226]MBU4612665.1 bifunctional hydroxymethylpyrimidine kinase/phosphomethylpyrimidine kinase [Verticiella sp. GG226]